MSNPTLFGANGDAFRGGSITRAGAPGAVGGAIAGPSNGASLIGSVAGGTPMLARNSRGSNITVPYARVVFHPPGNTALPPSTDTDADKDKRKLELDLASRMLKTPATAVMAETEMLYSGRLAFVLGRRGNNYHTNVESAMGLDLLSAFGGPAIRGAQLHLAPGTGGIATAQRLCSFEYLERYFSHVLSSRFIVVDDDVIADVRKLAPNLAGAAANMIRARRDRRGVDFSGPIQKNPAALNVEGILQATSDAPEDSYEGLESQGIDSDNDTPFLHGKSRNRKLHLGSRHQKTNLVIGDEIAFKWLYSAMLGEGVLDWTPDGVVMSKLSEGDKLLDDELDSRDGMLFNVAISGPAICSLWSQDAELEVMPLDRVFIVIIADRWVGNRSFKTADTEKPMPRVDYKALKEAEFNKCQGPQLAKKAGSKFTLTNFRIKRMTSAQMVAACMGSDGGRTRLQLKRCANIAEYIVGGWSIGSVIDSAASRAASGDSSTLMGAMKRTRVNSAHNLVVKCEWWSSDKLCRAYGPRNRRARYDPPKTRLPLDGAYPSEVDAEPEEPEEESEEEP